jgi:hypothetical protein
LKLLRRQNIMIRTTFQVQFNFFRV